MSISEMVIFLTGFVGSAAMAAVIMFLARNTGSMRRGQRPGTDFYSGPTEENPTGFTPPTFTDVTPIHGEGQPHTHISVEPLKRVK
jgi:hypothetical protein